MSKKVSLKGLFGGLERELATKLGTLRLHVSHPGAKGSATEGEWIKLLSSYLPRRYAVANGFVVDSKGAISDQIDLIIYDRHFSPLIFHQDDAPYVPAESVFGVFEVKQTLNKSHIEYAGKKAASVRVLERTSAPFPGVERSFDPRNLSPIIAGLLATEAKWTPAFGASFCDALGGLVEDQRLDLGCVVGAGAWSYTSDGKLVTSEDESTALVTFLFRLLTALRDFANPPAIDYETYLENALGESS